MSSVTPSTSLLSCEPLVTSFKTFSKVRGMQSITSHVSRALLQAQIHCRQSYLSTAKTLQAHVAWRALGEQEGTWKKPSRLLRTVPVAWWRGLQQAPDFFRGHLAGQKEEQGVQAVPRCLCGDAPQVLADEGHELGFLKGTHARTDHNH